jgi:phosphatidylethanolamine/phosphatidyl-N-methylethanolamine N-methyltransferase
LDQNKTKSLWSEDLAQDYERANYGSGLGGRVMRRSHELVEVPFGADVHFSRVLEVGAGSGVHIRYIRHSFDEYVMTDMSDAMLNQIPASNAARGVVTRRQEDASKLSFGDASFDRVIATHVLEHLYKPHEILSEWARVLRTGGVLSLVLPCDPGVAWRLGRCFGPRTAALNKGIAYDYVMALEHVNSITNLVAIIGHHFPNKQENWWPMRIPSTDLNLIYTVNITK